jgi:hypothetical protein
MLTLILITFIVAPAIVPLAIRPTPARAKARNRA